MIIMNKIYIFIFASLLVFATFADAAVSSGGGGRGGSFSGGSSFSRGGSYSGSNSFSRPSQSYSAPRSSTTTTTTTTRRSSSGYSEGYGYGGGYMPYGGFGMGYGYTNGILTGLIIGNMMHPTGTVMYSGPGAYANNALLYPDGRVVDQSGHIVGTYNNGSFNAIENGGMAAQPIPHDAIPPQQQPIPINVQTKSVFESIIEWILSFMLLMLVLFFVYFCIWSLKDIFNPRRYQ